MTHANSFIFKSCRFDAEDSILRLNYGYLSGESFSEIISFPGARKNFTPEEHDVLEKAMHALHIAAGISYYKAFSPHDIIIENQSLNTLEAEFFYKFYLLGLGEFSVENNLDLRKVIKFPVACHTPPSPSPLPLAKANVIPIGGGKDSLVSLEIIKKSGRPYRPIAINAGRPIREVIECSGSPAPILISRKIDPALFSLNDQGAYNGHVPITGILSFIMAFAALLYGYDTVIMSNEQSANESNMTHNDIAINHQYSKSLEFEQDFSSFITTHIMTGFRYFSLLRPLSESGIAALFAREAKYFPTFKSCNRNFHIAEGDRKYGWCCDCPKCRFVYLALAPFIGKEGMIRIFGRDMMDDPTQEDGFRELLGLKGHKPFECVGEIGECRILLKSLALLPEWKDCYLVSKLAPEIAEPGSCLADLKTLALTKYKTHNLPPEYERMLDDYIGFGT